MATPRTRNDESPANQSTLSEQTVTDATTTTDTEDEKEFDAAGATAVAGAHFSHDLYSAFRDPLIPLVQEKFGASLTIVSLMVPAQQFPSVLQPFIGALADRTSKRWFVVLAPAVAGISISGIGLAPHIVVVLLLLLTAGLASAAFHAPAVALAGDYGGSKMGRAMAMFQAAGALSRGLGPLILTGIVALFTLEGLWVAAIFGVAASIALYFTVDTTESDAANKKNGAPAIRPLLRARLQYVSALLGFGLLRNIGRAPFTIFLVAFLLDKGRSEWYAGTALSVVFASGVLGSFLGGILSDRFGRRVVLAGTVIMMVPTLYAYLLLENGSWWAMSILVLVGTIAQASGPVELAFGQEIMPEARGSMAGLIMAFRFVSMSIIAFIFGAIADSVGLTTAFWFIPAASLVALIVIPFLPRENQPLPQPGS